MAKTKGVCWQKNPALCRLHGYASKAHTERARAELKSATDEYMSTYNAGSPSPELYETYNQKLIAYYATPDGQRQLQQSIAELQGTPNIERLSELVTLQERTRMWIDMFEGMHHELQRTEENTRFDKKTGAQRIMPLPPATNYESWKQRRILSNFVLDGVTPALIEWDSKTGHLIMEIGEEDIEGVYTLGKCSTEAEAVARAEKYFNQNLVTRVYPQS